MKTHLIPRTLALVAAMIAMAGPARASFHLYDIQEVFSNGDGTVQFIELFTTFGSQQFLTGHTLTFQINSTTQSSVVLSDLPGDTTNKTFLIGTATLATLYAVTPDFLIPTNFLTAGANNFISFAEGTDRVNLSLLPTNGTSSLNGQIGNSAETSAATSVNAQATPKNFAGQTTTIPETTAAALGLLALGMMVLLRKRN
ncbi:MAG: hypothetical protein ABIT37_19290 [Luteolibacter sp.]